MSQAHQARVEAGLNDFLMLLLKTCVLRLQQVTGREFAGFEKNDVMRAEGCDLKFQKTAGGDIRLAAVPGEDPVQTKIIVPNGESPIQVFKSFRSDGTPG